MGQPSGWIQVVLGIGAGFGLLAFGTFIAYGLRATSAWLSLAVGLVICGFGLLGHFGVWGGIGIAHPIIATLTVGLLTGIVGSGVAGLMIFRAHTRVVVEARLFELLNQGDAALHAFYDGLMTNNPEQAEAGKRRIEEWRSDFGNYCNEQPSLRRRHATERILSSSGDRITEPLIRLRNMIDSLDQWLD